MELLIGFVALLVVALIVSESRSRHNAYTLKRNHMASLMRLDDSVRVNLPPVAGELMSAAIEEELDEV